MPRASSHELLLVSKALKEKLDALALGARLVRKTGYDVEQLRAKATLDRYSFAKSILATAYVASRLKRPMYRLVVCRAYYAMYHALRAATFFVHGGDDHEKHLDLPSKLPSNFPDRSKWENVLKNARYERNRADYDPYPRNDVAFREIAASALADATSLMPVVKQYLRDKGCAL